MTELCVTLERGVITPESGYCAVFRARERSEGDDVTQFFGVNFPDVDVFEISNDNIRAVTYLDMDDDD